MFGANIHHKIAWDVDDMRKEESVDSFPTKQKVLIMPTTFESREMRANNG